tara:strand:+ start:247 stop:441 length:195 start_codon:yes stop_codon:yes gene_type:complete
MREGLFQESLIVGGVTFVIGSLLMLVPIKGIWWAYLGTFLVGFLGHYFFELSGMNHAWAKEILQ